MGKVNEYIRKTGKKLKLYAAIGVLTGSGLLAACKKNPTGPQNEPTGIEHITPSQGVETPTPTQEVQTPTPEPTESATTTPEPTATPIPTPTIDVTQIKISVDDLLKSEYVYDNPFGEYEGVDKEIEKRKAYALSHNILSNDELDYVLSYFNIDFIKENGTKSDMHYLDLCNDSSYDKLSEIFRKWLRATKQNPNDILNPAWLVCGDNEKAKLMVNGFFTECYKATCFTSEEVSDRAQQPKKFSGITSIFESTVFAYRINGEKYSTMIKREDLSASLIATLFKMSKAAFQESVSCLYRNRIVDDYFPAVTSDFKNPLMEEINNIKSSLSNSAREDFGNDVYVEMDWDNNQAYASDRAIAS
ncbi:MAG: hypothetical protein K6E71_08445 [Lachnospiraceae bacterium]|nr:hypothetical protein [Lachnospiraceae bacterium]